MISFTETSSAVCCVQIQSHEEVYTWINQTLLPNLYSSDWYNGQELTSWREVLQTSDRSTIRLGVARLRQMRIKDGQFACVNHFKASCSKLLQFEGSSHILV